MPFIAELKRRNVFRVAAAYGIVGWLLIEVASVVLPTFEAPDWVMKVFTFLVILGFPLALILAWAFELTPEGIKREKDVESAESITHVTGRKLDFAIIALLVVALSYFAVDKFVLRSGTQPVREVAEPAAGGVSDARKDSIAVLPFANRSANAEDAFFVDGMHDDILTHLARIRSIKVISRTSVMDYRDTKKNLKTIGRELGAAAILEGGVQRAGDQIRVNVQLIDAETDEHLWADIFDRQLTAANIFAIQTEIATAIADALRAALSPEERELLDRVPTENMAALEAYFRAKQLMEKRSIAALAEATDGFSRAIELDPGFALAYVGLADSYTLQAEYAGLPLDEMTDKAQAAIDEALALDDQLAEAYTSLGSIEHNRNRYAAAEAAYRRALELNPNYVTTHHWFGLLLGEPLGRGEEALAHYLKAAELDPRSPIVLLTVGVGHTYVGRFEECLAWLRKAIEVDPGFAFGYQMIGEYHVEIEGRIDEGVRWFRKGLSLDPGNHLFAAILGWAFMDLGDVDRAVFWSEKSLELAPESFIPNLTMEMLALYRGDPSTAWEYARKAFGTRHYWIYEFSSFEPVRIGEMTAGRWLEARTAYEGIAPELFDENLRQVGASNYRSAIGLALVLAELGESERADRLLESSLRYIQQIPRIGFEGYRIADVQIHALRGDRQQALASLRQAIDDGWRRYWWYDLEHDPVLKSLHDEPEYRAMVEEIEADMAVQLERVRELERNGELAPIPERAAQ